MMRWYEKLPISQKQILNAWLFLAVPTIFYVVIRFYPTVDGFYLSLMNWNVVGKKEFIGLDNYVRLFQDPLFWQVVGNTFLYLALGLPVSLLLSFLIAYYLEKVIVWHALLRSLYFIPFLTTAVAMGWVWRWFYQPVPVGIFNLILVKLGLDQQPFLESTSQSLPSILAPAVWAGLGFQIVIFIAGLKAIPKTYYEAARIDGAGNGRLLWHITLPLLRPTALFLVVISSIQFLRIFDQVYNMTRDGDGGPLNSSKPLVLNIYQSAFSDYEMGYAAAQTVVLFVILLIITMIQLRLMRNK